LWQPKRLQGTATWGICYADATGQIQRKVIGTLAQARHAYQERKREVRLRLNTPELAEAARGRVTFQEVMDAALAYCRRHAGYDDDMFRAKRMCSWWGSMPATALTPQEIELRFESMTALKNHSAEKRPMSDATRNRYRSQLSLAYQLAQKYGKVPGGFNPARLVKLRKEPARVRWLSADEEMRLREVLAREFPDRPWARVLDLALNCGLRWGDQSALTPAQRDGERLLVDIGKTGVPVGLKLNEIAAEAFAALEAEAEGSRIHPRKQYRWWWDKARRLAGITNFHWHDLRHTFATRLLEADVPMEKVQKYLGHKTIAMAQRYAHVVEGCHDDGLEKLAEINRRCAQGGGKVMSIGSGRTKKLKQVAE
jgi:integrase